VTTFDVFLSHAWVDQLSAERVAERPQRGLASELVRRLEAAGLSVFYDADDIHDGDQITDTARAALANSSAFVVWYSSMYPTRQACRWELTTATRIDREMERIIAINPEADGAHLTGTPLKDTRIAACPAVTDDAAWAALVDGVVSTVRAANDTIFGEIVETPVDWFPERQRPAVRFTGRLRELWKLHELLTAHALTGQQQAVGNAAVVDGLAGSGKTVLVLEYAQRYAPAWPGGVVWIKGHGYTQGSDVEVDQAAVRVLLAQELTGVATSMGLDLGQLDAASGPAATITTLRALIGSALDGRGPVLWIVDDLHPGLSADVLQDWLAPGNLNEAMSLVTSRSTEYDYGVARLTLDSLAPVEALWLLTKDQPPADDAQRDAARQLVELLGGHPLAIDVTRAGISGPDGYVKWLERMSGGVVAELDHLGQRVGSLTADHETSISATMALSIERLGGNARVVLTALACYAPLPIPLSIIDDIVDDGGLEAIRACELAVDELERASLARVATDDTVTVHRLVQLVAQQLLGVTQELVLAHHEAAAGVIMGLTAEMDQGLVAGPYRHHFELSRSLQMHEETAYALAGWQGLYLLLAGQYSDAALHFQHVLQHYAATLGGADPRTLSAAQYLAVALTAVGNVDDAFALTQSVYDGYATSLGADHPQTLQMLTALGGLLQMAGRYEEAIETGEAVLAAYARIDAEPPMVVGARVHLGDAYLMVGQPDIAILHFEAYVEYATQALDPRDRELLNVRISLASAYGRADRFEEAIAMASATADDVAQVLGPQHPDALIARAALGRIYLEGERGAEAVAVLQELPDEMSQVLGAGHRSTITARGNLAEALRVAGQIDLAIQQSEALIAQIDSVFGAGHPETLTAREHLGNMYRDAERNEDATAAYEEVWRGRQAVLSPADPDMLLAAINLARMLWVGGSHKDAIRLMKDTIRDAERVSGHPDLEPLRHFLAQMKANR